MSYGVGVFPGDGTGRVGPASYYQSAAAKGTTTSGAFPGLAVADLNRDGLADVVANPVNNFVSMLLAAPLRSGACANPKTYVAGPGGGARGTPFGDLIRGTAGSDRIGGGPGDDCLYGDGGTVK